MHERVRALSGTFTLLREGKKTFVRCRLPLSEAAQDKAVPQVHSQREAGLNRLLAAASLIAREEDNNWRHR